MSVLLADVRLELEVVPCDLCGGTIFRPYWRRMRHGLDLETKICEQCGLVQTSPRPTPEANAVFYETLYPRFHGRESVEAPKWLDRSTRNGHDRAAFLRAHVSATEPKTIFEVGVGAGGFLEAIAATTSWKGSGVEAGDEAAAFCKAKGLDVQQGFFEDVELPSVDVIAAFHVFEHLLSPSQFLVRARTALGDQGILFLEVPNVARATDLNHFFQLPHLYSFSSLTLANMLRINGFRPTFWWERKKFMRVLAVPSEPVPVANIERYDIDAFIEQRAEAMDGLTPPRPRPRLHRVRWRIGTVLRKAKRRRSSSP